MDSGERAPLQALIVDDSDDDRALLVRELERGGFAVAHRRVDSPEALRDALERQPWDIVFGDYTMPRFKGTDALAIVRASGLDLPFIFVSGTIGEDLAVAAMRAGAQDYIMKDNLKRLVPAVERELREAEIRRQRRLAEVERRASEARFRNILTMAADAVVAVDEEQRITLFNQGAERIFGYRAEELAGQPLERLLPERFHKAHRAHMRDFASATETARRMNEMGEVYGRRKDGSEFPAEASISKLDDNGKITFTVILRDITERKRAEERLHYLAHYDALTGLPNRFLFMDRLRQAMVEADRHQRLVGVALLGLDRFKTVNASLGHEVGDQLLKVVSKRLWQCLRKGDTVARQAGDEFSMVLASLGHPDHTAHVAQKILACMDRPFEIAGHELYVDASVGLTLFPLDDGIAEALLRNADTAMHRAKERGGNTFEFYAAEMMTKVQARLTLESELRRAVAQEQFELHYQPVVDLTSSRTSGVEALIRWRHPSRGMIPPDEFIPVAEEIGLIETIGEWVLRKSCRQCFGWERESGVPPMRLAVNVSPHQLQQARFSRTVIQALEDTGLDPRRLDLEITETTLMKNAETALHVMRELGELGVQFSIDDFGTGYSSLAYLKRLPIGRVKVDRSFVRDVSFDANDAAIVKAILSMAHNLGIPVIAEGVETKAQLEFLLEHGCNAAQGYYFSRPLAVDALIVHLMHGLPPAGG